MLSILIPTYNRTNYLKKCIDSIISYEWNYPYEIVIVDGSTNDETKKYVEKLN